MYTYHSISLNLNSFTTTSHPFHTNHNYEMASITPRRNPGRIRSSGSSTPVSRTPPRRTSTPTFSASTGTGAGAPPPSSAGQTRRSTRTSDPLGERATVQLIRRVLLPAQHSDQLTAATLLGQLPPLTSSNELDLQVYALLAIVLRDYVQAWYSRITPDDEFVGEIVHIMAHITTAMEQRMRKVDWESLLLDEIPELLEQHVWGRLLQATNVQQCWVEYRD